METSNPLDQHNKISTSSKTSPIEFIDIQQIYQAVWRKKWRIILLSFLAMIIASLLVMSIEPTFKATAKMQIEQQEAQILSIEQIYGIDGASSEYLKTQFELLRSRTLAERVVNELNLVNHPIYDFRQHPEPAFSLKQTIIDFDVHNLIPGLLPEDFAEEKVITDEDVFGYAVFRVMNQLEITPINKTQLVEIAIESKDPFLAADIANSFATNFINSQLDAEMEASLNAASWMNNRLTELRQNLKNSEITLQEFKEKEGLIDVGGIVTVSADELSAINQRLVDARAKLAEIRSQYQQVRSIKKSNWKKLASVPAVLSNPLVQTFKAEEAKAQAKVDEYSKRYGQRHPYMQTAIGELKSAQASLKTHVEQIAASIKRQYQIAAANVNSLKQSVKENKQEIQSISKNEFRLRELQREVNYNKEIFDTFMTRYKETTATTDLDTSNARIVDKANVPGGPIKPNKKLIIILAGILAGLLAVLLTIIVQILNNTFKTTEDVESKLNLPVLGIIPLIKRKKDQKVGLTFHKDNHKIFTECVRTIRTSVMLSSLDTNHKVVVVTSSIPGEGKSTISINLSDAISQMEKTILIEADMRRPTISKILGLPPGTPGLANLITGSNTLDECIQSLYGGIDTIVAGVVPPNPLELISSDRFEKLILELSEKYDRIIIDSPPVHAVSDTLVLSKYADSVIYIVKSDSTDIKVAEKGIGKLLQNKSPVRGVILNQVDIQKSKKQGYTFDGYYDYYGYSSGDTKNLKTNV